MDCALEQMSANVCQCQTRTHWPQFSAARNVDNLTLSTRIADGPLWLIAFLGVHRFLSNAGCDTTFRHQPYGGIVRDFGGRAGRPNVAEPTRMTMGSVWLTAAPRIRPGPDHHRGCVRSVSCELICHPLTNLSVPSAAPLQIKVAQAYNDRACARQDRRMSTINTGFRAPRLLPKFPPFHRPFVRQITDL
jgi:hypothetical protein